MKNDWKKAGLNGKVRKVFNIQYDKDMDTEKSICTEIIYNENGFKTAYSSNNKYIGLKVKELFAYGDNGELLSIFSEYEDNGDISKKTVKYVYEWSNDHTITRTKLEKMEESGFYAEDDDFYISSVVEFNRYGDKVMEKRYLYYADNGELANIENTTCEYKYDCMGNMEFSHEKNYCNEEITSEIRTSYRYDNNCLTEINGKVFLSDGDCRDYTEKYDGYGNILKKVFRGKIDAVCKNTLDEHKNVVREESYDSDGNLNGIIIKKYEYYE